MHDVLKVHPICSRCQGFFPYKAWILFWADDSLLCGALCTAGCLDAHPGSTHWTLEALQSSQLWQPQMAPKFARHAPGWEPQLCAWSFLKTWVSSSCTWTPQRGRSTSGMYPLAPAAAQLPNSIRKFQPHTHPMSRALNNIRTDSPNGHF